MLRECVECTCVCVCVCVCVFCRCVCRGGGEALEIMHETELREMTRSYCDIVWKQIIQYDLSTDKSVAANNITRLPGTHKHFTDAAMCFVLCGMPLFVHVFTMCACVCCTYIFNSCRRVDHSVERRYERVVSEEGARHGHGQ